MTSIAEGRPELSGPEDVPSDEKSPSTAVASVGSGRGQCPRRCRRGDQIGNWHGPGHVSMITGPPHPCLLS